MTGALEGRVAMITGAQGALGRAVAEAARAAGAALALVDRPRSPAERADAGDAGAASSIDDALVLEGDLASEADAARVVAGSVAHFGHLDVLVNVAGGFELAPPFPELSVAAWDRMLTTNARTVFLACRAAIPHLLASERGGKIVNVAARAALEGKARLAPYVASKAVVVRLTESLAAEYRAAGLNVNCVLPGTIDTARNRHDMPNADFGRWVPPAAIADVIVFLASDAARAVHGAAIPVYGVS